MTSVDDVLLSRQGALGHITLNRPKALNALTHEMCASILGQLLEWTRDSDVKAVLIDAVPGRAFCAGGDLRAIYESGRKHDGTAQAFFTTEYRLNAAVKHFPKPYVALIDGIAMGGGVGVSVHGSHRVVSENALFAMPETGIGLFPDVGGSYFLPRLPGELGMYLALTGARIGPSDMLYTGAATHFIPAAKFAAIAPRLAKGEPVDRVLESMNEQPGPPPLADHRAVIDRVFSASSMEDLMERLNEAGAWGRETASLLRERSPTSLKLTFRQMREGRRLDFDSCMRMEYRLTNRVLAGHDFYEGVRVTLIDKGKRPHWQPPTLDAVSDAAIAPFFVTLGDQELIVNGQIGTERLRPR
ncbi:MAG TPA: enoyl-CoA hydratase/isomerase family protein [Micropepsaceae bacterium]|nr:enoyl-CoA hydratase/isomerase family protein [Micropepsaceae bacterium]